MIVVYITSVLLLIYCCLILLYRRLWLSVPLFHRKKTFVPSTVVTVIIPARNESLNITTCVKSILSQQFPHELMQVIVVDDQSEDDTWQLASSFNDSRLIVLRNDDFSSNDIPHPAGKKKAIATGIRHAKGTLIITTDADCTHPENWLQTIVAFYEEKGSALIAAPVMYSNPQSFLEIFQALDFISLQGITAAAVHHRLHMMSNGANLAYEKSAFATVHGFEGIDELASGDDLLLMQKIAVQHKDRVMYCNAAEATVSTKAAESWTAFFQQRIRWASKARFYKDYSLSAVLLLVFLLNFSFVSVFIMAFFDTGLFLYLLILLLIKTLIELTFMFPIVAFFRQQKLLWYFPLSQPLHIIYTIIAGLFGQVKEYNWKGRRTK